MSCPPVSPKPIHNLACLQMVDGGRKRQGASATTLLVRAAERASAALCAYFAARATSCFGDVADVRKLPSRQHAPDSAREPLTSERAWHGNAAFELNNSVTLPTSEVCTVPSVRTTAKPPLAPTTPPRAYQSSKLPHGSPVFMNTFTSTMPLATSPARIGTFGFSAARATASPPTCRSARCHDNTLDAPAPMCGHGSATAGRIRACPKPTPSEEPRMPQRHSPGPRSTRARHHKQQPADGPLPAHLTAATITDEAAHQLPTSMQHITWPTRRHEGLATRTNPCTQQIKTLVPAHLLTSAHKHSAATALSDHRSGGTFLPLQRGNGPKRCARRRNLAQLHGWQGASDCVRAGLRDHRGTNGVLPESRTVDNGAERAAQASELGVQAQLQRRRAIESIVDRWVNEVFASPTPPGHAHGNQLAQREHAQPAVQQAMKQSVASSAANVVNRFLSQVDADGGRAAVTLSSAAHGLCVEPSQKAPAVERLGQPARAPSQLGRGHLERPSTLCRDTDSAREADGEQDSAGCMRGALDSALLQQLQSVLQVRH